MEIIIEDLSKVYRGGIDALKNVSFSIPPGMFGLLGPNGAGKTTLIRILATLLKPTRGEVKIGEYRLSNSNDQWKVREMLGYLPQELQMYRTLSANEFLSLIAAFKNVEPREKRQQQVEYVLEVTNLQDVARRHIRTFSGGMKRRLGIAQALLGNPQLLIVDEPTVGLDPQERVKLRNLLVELAQDRTVLLSTHIIEDVEHTCSQIAVINKGEVMYSGSSLNLIQQAENKVWEFITTEPFIPNQATLISSASIAEGTRYRVLASEPPHPAATQTPPSMEDAYLWLLNNR